MRKQKNPSPKPEVPDELLIERTLPTLGEHYRGKRPKPQPRMPEEYLGTYWREGDRRLLERIAASLEELVRLAVAVSPEVLCAGSRAGAPQEEGATPPAEATA